MLKDTPPHLPAAFPHLKASAASSLGVFVTDARLRYTLCVLLATCCSTPCGVRVCATCPRFYVCRLNGRDTPLSPPAFLRLSTSCCTCVVWVTHCFFLRTLLEPRGSLYLGSLRGRHLLRLSASSPVSSSSLFSHVGPLRRELLRLAPSACDGSCSRSSLHLTA